MIEITKNVTDRHATARKWAAAGIPVFPCQPGGKEPATPHSFDDASIDLSQIDAWWNQADFNPAVEPERAGWCVVDLDCKNGGKGLENWQALQGEKPPTYTVATASGGRHLYYRGSLPNSAGTLAANIDTRGRRGYVLLPGSVVDGKPYVLVDDTPPAPLPRWIADALGARDKTAWTAPDNVMLDDGNSCSWFAQLLREDVEINGEPREGEGSDQRAYNLVGLARDGDRRGYTLAPETICDLMYKHWAPHFDYEWLWSKAKRALDPKEYTNMPGCGPAGSAERYGQLAGTGAEIFGKATEGIEPAPALPGFKRASALAGMTFEPVRWTWDQRIVANKPNLLTGNGGSGKTTLALNLAVAVAAGIPCLGAETRQSNVVLLLGEDGYERINANLAAIRQALGVEGDTLDRIHVFSAEDEDVPAGSWLVQINDDGTDIRDSAFMRDVVAPRLADIAGPVLFVVDPLIQFAVFNQIADRAVGTLARTWFKSVCRIGDVTCLVNDHPSAAGMESGRHFAGSREMRNAFPNFSTLIAGEWTGGLAKQKKLTLKGMRNRYGVEETVEFYRTSQDGAVLRLHALPGQSPQDHARRVYEHVLSRHEQGLLTARDNRGKYGSGQVAHALGMDLRDVEIAIKSCLGLGTLVDCRASGEGKTCVPAHLEPGPNAPPKAAPDDY